MLLKVNSSALSEPLKNQNSQNPQNFYLDLDKKLYRQDSPEEITIENEQGPVDHEIIESSHSEYLSYKSANYYEVKNNLRRNAYFEINNQCAIASIPGILDIFADSNTNRILVKLHLSDEEGNHTFKVFRSNGALQRHSWKYLVVQVDREMIRIYLNAVLDTQINLGDYSILFEEMPAAKQKTPKHAFYKQKNSNEYQHNGLLIGNIDRTHPNAKLDKDKYWQVYNHYKSKSLMDPTHQRYFDTLHKVKLTKNINCHSTISLQKLRLDQKILSKGEIAFDYSTLTGRTRADIALGCFKCDYNSAYQSCPKNFKICSSLEFLSFARQEAKQRGWVGVIAS